MLSLNNPLEIYKLLPKTNCKECSCRTCLAFADSVYKGIKKLDECPYLDNKIALQTEVKVTAPINLQLQQEQALESLKKEISSIDFASSADRIGAVYSNNTLNIISLGKIFSVESDGNIVSDCHITTWVTIPLLNYVLYSKGLEFSGTWVPFRELNNGKIRQPLFNQRCEKPLKQIADNNTELFENLLHIFGGKPVFDSFSSDIAMILYPLPKVPLLITYSKNDDDYDSNFNLFFDAKAEENLNIESLHMICSGMVTMFEKIATRHG